MAVYVAFVLLHLLMAWRYRERPWILYLAVVVNLVFVGLRWELGFDWPLYKDQFAYLSTLDSSVFFERLSEIQDDFAHEIGYLLLSFGATRLLGSYEAFQFLLFGFFLFSFVRLCRALECTNPIAALLLVHLFMLFSLEFSTVRQLAAIAFFNLALAQYFTRRRVLAVVSAGLAVSMHLSAGFYVVALLVSVGATGHVWAATLAALAGVVAVNAPTLSVYVAALLPEFAADKLNFYFNIRVYGGSLIERLHAGATLVSLGLLGLHMATRERLASGDTRRRVDQASVLGKLLLVLSVAALAIITVNTLRNRILYEVVILGAIGLFSPGLVRMRAPTVRRLRVAISGLAVILFAVFLTQTSRFVYVPYQNFVVADITGQESTGMARQQELWALIRTR